MLSITDEISMVGFKQFQSMNQTMCTLKGTTDGNWGYICVIAVSNLYHLPPVGQCPIYMSPQSVHTLTDIAPNGWEKMQLHGLTQSMRQKDIKFVNCLNKIHTTVPLEGSEEDRMLQSHELKLNHNHENYPHVKINVRGMITTNIDVTDGLTNNAMGTVTNVVVEQTTGNISVILIAFDSEHVGQEARYTSVYNSTNQNAVPIHQTQATFPVDKKASFQATKTQFPLTLAWAVTIHECQGLTLSEIDIDMTPAKDKYKPGEAYVTFSRVKTLDKLHIINYTWSEIHVSEHVEKEMKRLRKNILPQMSSNLFHDIPRGLKIFYLNIGNLKRKIEDIKDNDMFKNSDIISLIETHLGHSDTLAPDMMCISKDV